MNFSIKSQQKYFDSLAHFLSEFKGPPDVIATVFQKLKLLKPRCISTSIYMATHFFIATAKPKQEVWHFTLRNYFCLAERMI